MAQERKIEKDNVFETEHSSNKKIKEKTKIKKAGKIESAPSIPTDEGSESHEEKNTSLNFLQRVVVSGNFVGVLHLLLEQEDVVDWNRLIVGNALDKSSQKPKKRTKKGLFLVSAENNQLDVSKLLLDFIMIQESSWEDGIYQARELLETLPHHLKNYKQIKETLELHISQRESVGGIDEWPVTILPVDDRRLFSSNKINRLILLLKAITAGGGNQLLLNILNHYSYVEGMRDRLLFDPSKEAPYQGLTLIQIAASCGNYEVTKTLLYYVHCFRWKTLIRGRELTDNNSPFFLALRNNHARVIWLLLDFILISEVAFRLTMRGFYSLEGWQSGIIEAKNLINGLINTPFKHWIEPLMAHIKNTPTKEQKAMVEKWKGIQGKLPFNIRHKRKITFSDSNEPEKEMSDEPGRSEREREMPREACYLSEEMDAQFLESKAEKILHPKCIEWGQTLERAKTIVESSNFNSLVKYDQWKTISSPSPAFWNTWINQSHTSLVPEMFVPDAQVNRQPLSLPMKADEIYLGSRPCNFFSPTFSSSSSSNTKSHDSLDQPKNPEFG